MSTRTKSIIRVSKQVLYVHTTPKVNNKLHKIVSKWHFQLLQNYRNEDLKGQPYLSELEKSRHGWRKFCLCLRLLLLVLFFFSVAYTFLTCRSAKMETFFWYNICTSLFSGFAFLSNLASLIYIKKTFDTKQTLYHILSLDAQVTLASATISLVMFCIIGSSHNFDELSCSLLFLGSAITVMTSPLCNFMVSMIR